jgi:uncharacterized lipoprotein YajG
MTKFLKGLLLMTTIFMLTGCVSSRGLQISVPQETIVKPNGMQVYIRSIEDNREFQVRPSSPDIPSFGSKKDIGNLAIKCRTIGRQRNGYGKAMRNIFLDENQKVEAVVYEAVKSSLYSLGYVVTDSKEQAKGDAIVMDIKIDKFWSWIIFGAWTARIDTNIKTTIVLTAASKALVIEGAAQNHCQTASTANWKKSIKLAINNYILQAKDKLRCLPAGC